MTVQIPLILLLFLHPNIKDMAADPSECRCQTAKLVDGWCPKCKVGYYATLRIESTRLFEAIDSLGHDIVVDKTRCPTCRAAIQNGGFCEDCGMGGVNGRGYFTRVCYDLAKGRLADPARTRLACCPANGDWCSTCSTGWVGNRVFSDRTSFENARRSFTVLQAAVEKAALCEHCAVAILTNSRCFQCKITYRNGKALEATTKPSTATEKPTGERTKKLGEMPSIP